jgi:hypothetical protein
MLRSIYSNVKLYTSPKCLSALHTDNEINLAKTSKRQNDFKKQNYIEKYKKNVFVTSSKLCGFSMVTSGITNIVFAGESFRVYTNMNNGVTCDDFTSMMHIPILYLGFELGSKIMASYYAYKFIDNDNMDKKYKSYVISGLVGISNAHTQLSIFPIHTINTCISFGTIIYANNLEHDVLSGYEDDLHKGIIFTSLGWAIFAPITNQQFLYHNIANSMFTITHNFNDIHKMNKNYKKNKCDLYDDALNFSLNTTSPITKISKLFSENFKQK